MRHAVLAAFTALAAPVLLGAPAHAAMTVEEAEAILFDSHDANGDDFVTPRELEEFRSLAFAASDADGDGRISAEEWKVFDPGFLNIAIERGLTMELADAKGETFARYDTSGDDHISDDELTAAIFRDYVAVDEDDDGRLSRAEFARVRLVSTLSASLQQQ